MTRFLIVQDSPPSEGYHNWLVKEMSKLGIQSADCQWLNVIDEFPEGAGGKPLASQKRAWQEHFYEKLAAAQVKVIIPMGPDAARAVLGMDRGIDEVRGYVFDAADLGLISWKERQVVGEYKTNNPKKGYKKGDPRWSLVTVQRPPSICEGAVIIPTYSVQYVITKRKKPFYALAQDLRRAKTAADGRLIMTDAVFDRGRAFESAIPINHWEPEGAQFAFDIETPMDSRDVRMISFSDGVRTFAFNWTPEVREWSRRYLENPKYTKYAHNAMFDVPRLRDAGCPVVGPIKDTMMMGQLLQPDLLKRLGSMASVYLNLKPWKLYYESDPFFYSAKDSFVEARLAMELERRIELLGMGKLVDTIMRSLPVLLSMHEEGIRVDLVAAQRWANELQAELIQLDAKWTEMLPPGAVCSASSPRQVADLFYRFLGCVPARRKDDGETADAEALFDLKATYPEHKPLIEVLEKHREVKKQYGTYAKTLAGLFMAGENRVHPQYLPGGIEGETFGRKGSASTGRLGVSNPNIQNQTVEARRVYIPDSTEHCFIEYDYSQAELRVIAALSNDERLQEALSGDIHSITAARLGIPRPLAKNSIYAAAYLGGAKTVQSMAKKNGVLLEIPDIKRAQALLKQEYVRMFAWQRAVVEEGSLQGYLINPFGRVRFFYGGKDDGPEMADFKPQSTIADITWQILPELHAWAIACGGRIVTQVHDSFLFCVLAKRAKEAAARFKEIMEREFPEVAPGFRIPVSGVIGEPGQAWGYLK